MASAYLSLAKSTPTNAKKFTVSVWVKKAGVSSSSGYYIIDSNGAASGSECPVAFDGNQKLRFGEYNSGDVFNFICNAVSRDPSGWMHVVVAGDSTQSTSSDRIKIYQNGELQSGTGSYPSQNHDFGLTKGSSSFNIGRWLSGTSRYFDGQMAHFHFVDGTTYTPTTFGETDATTGIWKPKTDPGISTSNYGNNGFFLKFDNSANMGLDSSGNSNNFTTNGTIIQTKDSPSNVFAKINILDNYYNGQASGSLSVINTKIQTAGSGTETYTLSTLGASKGKYYCEMKLVSSTAAHQTRFGIAYAPSNGTADWLGKRAVGWSLRQDGTPTNNNSTISGTFASYTAGDIISMAVDLDNSKLYFRKNNDAWMNSGDPTSGSTGTGAISITAGETYLIGIGDETGGYSVCELNFGDGYFGTTAVASAENPDDGNGIFEYDVPAGYRALCTKSINAEEYS